MATNKRKSVAGIDSTDKGLEENPKTNKKVAFVKKNWPILLFLTFATVEFWPILWSDLFVSSDIVAGYPLAKWVYAMWPQYVSWCPYIFGGVHLMNGTFFNIFYFLGYTTAWIMYFHVFFAAVGMWFYLKRTTPAVFCAIAYGFTGFMVSHVFAGHDGKMMVMAYLPWILWLIDNISWQNAIFLGLLGWVSLSSGHIQMNYYLFVFCCVYLLFNKRLINWKKYLVSVIIAIALFIPQFMTLNKAVKTSTRSSKSYVRAVSYSMPPKELICIADNSYQGEMNDYVGDKGIKQHTEYMGILAVIALIVGLFLKPRLDMIVLGLVSLIISFGGYTPLYKLIYYIPPNGTFRSPSMAFYGFVFASVVIGYKAVEKTNKVSLLLALALWLNLWAITNKYVKPLSEEEAYGNVKDVAEFIAQDKGDFKIFTPNPEIADNRFMLWGIKSINGYYPLPRREFVDSVGGTILPDYSKLTIDLAKKMDVRYVVTNKAILPGRPVFIGKHYWVYKI